jgi:hypothetical protein
VGKYRGGRKPWETGDSAGRTLDPRQFPELNAVFYGGDPAEFIKMRIESLALMACDDEQLAPAFGAARQIGTAHFRPSSPPPVDARRRYIRTEAEMVAHHASETLLRLFFAHVEHQECPWLGMSASTSFAEFKAKVDDALERGFDRTQIALVFLGDTSPTDSCIQLSDDEFEDAIDAFDLLLTDCGNRFLGDSFLYNAVKHGVTAVGVDDEEAQIAFRADGGERTTLHKGPMHFYLHKAVSPAAPKNSPQWFYSCDDSNPGRDLAVSVLIVNAANSLWAVARRRYTGASGAIVYINRAEVEMVIYGATMIAGNLLKRLTSELVKLKADGNVDGTDHQTVSYDIPREWSIAAASDGRAKRELNLPARQRDRQVYSTSTQAYLPITPRGFQRG